MGPVPAAGRGSDSVLRPDARSLRSADPCGARAWRWTSWVVARFAADEPGPDQWLGGAVRLSAVAAIRRPGAAADVVGRGRRHTARAGRLIGLEDQQAASASKTTPLTVVVPL